MRILGIDPGTNILGYAIIEENSGTPELVHSGILDLRKEKDDYKKLQIIYQKVIELINTYTPNQCAIESPFYGKNAQSMIKLGRAQGVAIAAIISSGIEVREYAPRKVKIAVTGNGNASKEQVARMIQSILKTEIKGHKFDETDAIAIALCHYYNRSQTSNKQYTNWKDFARKKGLL
jgi:crossover junction endodeoxyribonuclease RuvC